MVGEPGTDPEPGNGENRGPSPNKTAALRLPSFAALPPKPGDQPIGLICTACLPLGPSFTSNSTFWFSLRVLKPLPWISEKWAKRSSPPPSGLMKPKPLESLNHFTVPVLIAFSFHWFPRSTRGGGASDERYARRELK